MVITDKSAMTAPTLTNIPAPNNTGATGLPASLQAPSVGLTQAALCSTLPGGGLTQGLLAPVGGGLTQAPTPPMGTLTQTPIVPASGGWIPASPCLVSNFGNLLWGKDSRWLTLDVCREFVRNKCCRSDEECRFAHPPPNVEVQNGRVMCCFDSIKGKCQRKDPPCKYLHPPQHLKEQLLQNGRNNLIIKHINMQLLAHGFLPAYPSLVYDMSGSLASYSSAYAPQLSSTTDPYSVAAGNQYVLASPTSYYTSYPVMPFMQQQQLEQPNTSSLQQQQYVAGTRCVAGSVESTPSSDQGSTSDQHTECHSPVGGTTQSCQHGICGTDSCGSSADDLASKMGGVNGGGRSVPWSLGVADNTCPTPLNIIPCPPSYYSPVYLPSVASYPTTQAEVFSQGTAALKRSISQGPVVMPDGKSTGGNNGAQFDGAMTDRTAAGCSGYVMYPVTAPAYAPATAAYAPIPPPTQHLTYMSYPVSGHQYTLPAQFPPQPSAVMARY